MDHLDYSIVIPVYYNEGSLEYTTDHIISEVFSSCPQWRGEIVFVDDGSGDDSLDELRQICQSTKYSIRVIHLSRNFGQVNAIWCGLEHTGKRPTVIISADGQDSIELIPKMLEQHFNLGKEIVICTREARDESLWRKITSSFVYGAIRRLGNKDMPIGGFDFMLLGGRAKAELIRCWQPNTFFQIRILELGFPRAFISYHRVARKAGVSRWTFGKKITYMIDGVLGHSYAPIRAMSILGLLVAGFSFLLAIFFFIAYFFNPRVVPGLTPIVLVVLFIGGIQMLMIGVLGEYLWRVLSQTRKSPPYVIESEFGSDVKESNN